MTFFNRYGTCVSCGCASHECECAERHESLKLRDTKGVRQSDPLIDDLVDEEELPGMAYPH